MHNIIRSVAGFPIFLEIKFISSLSPPNHYQISNWLIFVQTLAVQFGWYHNVVYLGEERGVPILTMTYNPILLHVFSYTSYCQI